MTNYYNPWASNPIVPAQFSLATYSLSEENTLFTFPSSLETGTNYLATYLIISSDNNTYKMKLPDARKGAVGIATRIINNGINNFSVLDFDGNLVIGPFESGEVYDLVLQENDTQDGLWKPLLIAGTTAGVQASQLQGLGLFANPSTFRLDVQPPITNYSTSFSITKTSQAMLINWTGSNIELALPANDPTPGGVQSGFWFMIKNSTTTNGTVTLSPPLGSTIDGQAELILTISQSASIFFDGTNYITTALTQSTYSQSVVFGPLGIRVLNGSALNPSYSFINTPSTGIFTNGGGDVSFTSSGNHVATIDTSGLNVLDGSLQIGGDNILYYIGTYPL